MYVPAIGEKVEIVVSVTALSDSLVQVVVMRGATMWLSVTTALVDSAELEHLVRDSVGLAWRGGR